MFIGVQRRTGPGSSGVPLRRARDADRQARPLDRVRETSTSTCDGCPKGVAIGLSSGEPRVAFEGPYVISTDSGLKYAVSPDTR